MTKACDSEKKKLVKEIHVDTKKQLRIKKAVLSLFVCLVYHQSILL